jgi:precorrin-4/cobalt-precorrin-4 C11-methyltransferase
MAEVFFVGAGPGDPDLITVKGMDLVKRAKVLVYTGSLVNRELVDRSEAPVKVDSHGKTLEEIVPLMTRYAREGALVVRLHTGDPSLYGAIIEQIDLLERAGVTCTVIPGVSSLFGAAAALKAQLTQTGVSDTLIITRPAGATLGEDQIPDLSSFKTTFVVFLGADKIREVIRKARFPAETPAAVVYHASWPDEIVLRGTVATIATQAEEAGIRKSALLMVGDVFDPGRHGLTRSVLYK